MSKKRRNQFNDTLGDICSSYRLYYERLMQIAISRFEWTGLPETVDERYLEMGLIRDGQMLAFCDDVTGTPLALNMTPAGDFDVYGIPYKRRAYSRYNSYTLTVDDENSTVIYNNYMHTSDDPIITMFAKRLYLYDSIIDVNVNAQKTPILVQGDEKQKLALENVYMYYQGNFPAVFADNNLDINSIKVLQTNAPFVADRIYTLKNQVWGEALTYLGVANMSIEKKSRLVTDEVDRSQGGVIASRNSWLAMRQQAIPSLERTWKLAPGTVSVQFREEALQDKDITNGGYMDMAGGERGLEE